jgi:serine phosphatase RsbU (regulator of sigma subunit)
MKKLLSPILLLLTISFTLCGQSLSELHQLSQDIINSDPNQAMQYANQLVAQSKNNSKDRVNGLNDLGNAFYYLDNYEEGEKTLLSSIDMAESINYKKGKAEGSVVLGNIYIIQGRFSLGLTFFTNALQLYEELKDGDGIANCYNGLGTINLNQEHYEKALEYFDKAITFGSAATKADSYVFVSQIYLRLEAYDDARKYAEMAHELGIKNDDLYVQASALDVEGVVATIGGNYKMADTYLKEALQMKEDLEDLQGTAMTLNYIGQNFKAMNQLDSAMHYILMAYEIADEIGATDELRTSLGELAKLYAIGGDYHAAFYHQTRFIEVNEAIFNDQASKKIAEMEAEMQAKLQEDQIALLEKDKAFQDQVFKIYIGLAIFVVIVLIIGGAGLYNRYQVKKRAHANLEQKNQIIEEQKHILEEKNTEIMDSITYAKRIQTAILPSDRYFTELLPTAFVLYKPKDIIAGDFYWLEQVQEENFTRLLFAAADCTGHGVPGAMVSVVCNNALNRSVREFELYSPSHILDKTRELVIEQFEKSESEVKDGMDISLCALIGDPNEKTYELQWAGANNPLWVVRKKNELNKLDAHNQKNDEVVGFEANAENEEYVLFEIKADKQPIGKYAEPRPYVNWKVQLQTGDTLYIFTDGYADQFGGEKGKKYMAANMKKLLLSIQPEPIIHHQNILDSTFESYRSSHEQIDDVCVIGLRL